MTARPASDGEGAAKAPAGRKPRSPGPKARPAKANGGLPRPAANGHAEAADGAAVDFRRFRTWDAEPAEARTPPWRILARYGYVRLASSWPGRTLLILLAIAAILTVGGSSYAFASGAGVSSGGWAGLMGIHLWPLAAILVMVAAPLFADDLRFNAPLFYFSKPIEVRDYFLGKLAFLGSVVAATVVVPILAVALLALLVGVPLGEPPSYERLAPWWDPAEQARHVERWHAVHIDTPGEWVSATLATVPGMVLLAAMFCAIAVACSVFTRRGWHAGMAFVAVVGGTSLAGGVLADSVRGAHAHLWSPTGWAVLIVGYPLRLLFPDPMAGTYEARELAGAASAIPIAYMLTIATAAAALWVSYRRLRAQEARL